MERSPPTDITLGQGGEKVGWGTQRKVKKWEKENRRRRRGRYAAKKQDAGDKRAGEEVEGSSRYEWLPEAA